LDGGVEVGSQRRGFGGLVDVDPDDLLLSRLDPRPAGGVGGDQLFLHVARLDCRDRAAEGLHTVHLGAGALDQLGHLGLHHVGTVEDVVVLEQVGLEGQHLLEPQRPLLVPRPGQAERLVPGRQLDGPGPGVLAQRDTEHLQHDALHVVLGLGLGQAE
jgi:hypothetical protein